MGDIVQTLPAVADLRHACPDGLIAWVVESRWAPLLAGNPSVDRVVPIALGAWRAAPFQIQSGHQVAQFIAGLHAAGFDLAIDFQGLIKSALIATLSGAKYVVGFEPTLLREALAGLAYSRRTASSSAHVVDRYRDLVASATGTPASDLAQFPLPEGVVSTDLPSRFVLASPQAGWGAKQWPIEHYSSLAARIWCMDGIPLVVDCHPSQRGLAHKIQAAAPKGAVIPHPSTIEGLIGATRAAQAVVGVDSGPLHVASAMGKPGVAIFGPTDPARNGPYGPGIVVLREPTAETTYKRGAEPSGSMRVFGPAAVYKALRPCLS